MIPTRRERIQTRIPQKIYRISWLLVISKILFFRIPLELRVKICRKQEKGHPRRLDGQKDLSSYAHDAIFTQKMD
jgi:hypothetical protein